MENASKALIIAGSILLAIALIGLGMGALNGVKGIITGTNMDEQEVASFNGKFLPYENTQRGNKILVLIDAVNANNRANMDDSSKCVSIEGCNITGTPIPNGDGGETYNDGDIKTGKNYDVDFDYDDSGSGLITKIKITSR
ncbi:MAG: hypothetical protein IKT41_01390 [Clostridia bacterium]|nr:hypothetical protein [Clostridia bacterium]